jgi:hypothetical protein
MNGEWTESYYSNDKIRLHSIAGSRNILIYYSRTMRLILDPYLKTTRAKKHIDDLQAELQSFYRSKPYQFTRVDDLVNSQHIIRFKVDPTPGPISLIAGDIFYNLRASLDQLVWYLSRLPSPQRSYPQDTQFPILDQRNRKLITRRTKGVSTEAVAIIESLQPYNTPNPPGAKDHLLWKLNKMCNIDKHSRIPIHGHSGQVMRPESIAALGYRFEAVGECFEMRIPLDLKHEMIDDPPITMKVVFGDAYWGVSCDFYDIEAMYEFVTNSVLPRFSQFME